MRPSLLGNKGVFAKGRCLRIESLEQREMLSVTLADLPEPDYDSAPAEVAAAEVMTVQAAAATTITLAPPKNAKTRYDTTLTTMTVYWDTPVATSKTSVVDITKFEVVLRNMSTKAIVETITTSGADARSVKFDGLDAGVRYEATITSCGDEGTSNTKSFIKVSATTAKFPLATVKAESLMMTTGTIKITDNDKITPFVGGKTVKTYTIEYVEKVSTKVDWTGSKKIPVGAGTTVADATRGYITMPVTGLKADTQYYVRVIATYTENGKTLTSEGRSVLFRTAKLPTTTLSKTTFTLLNGDLACGLEGKLTNTQKLGTATVSYQLQISIQTTTNKTTGELNGAVLLNIPSTAFSTADSKGAFKLNTPFAFSDLAEALGASTLTGVKSLSVQLVTTFDFGGADNKATTYSRAYRMTLPTWYII